MINYDEKKIIIADLDGTLAVSKGKMDSEMSAIINELLEYKSFAVISGGKYKQFEEQFVSGLEKSGKLERLYLFPTCATSFYKYMNNKWIEVYAEKLRVHEKKKIFESFKIALEQAGFKEPEKLYGELIEDRGTQITFSAYGQQAPIELKKVWDPDGKKRLHIKQHLDRLIPELEVRIGGTTSIDITRKGIDKAYGINKINEKCGFKTDEMLFIGDALFEGGNDYPVKTTGVECINVNGPEDTKKILREIISDSK